MTKSHLVNYLTRVDVDVVLGRVHPQPIPPRRGSVKVWKTPSASAAPTAVSGSICTSIPTRRA